jgi:hypothetical protein
MHAAAARMGMGTPSGGACSPRGLGLSVDNNNGQHVRRLCAALCSPLGFNAPHSHITPRSDIIDIRTAMAPQPARACVVCVGDFGALDTSATADGAARAKAAPQKQSSLRDVFRFMLRAPRALVGKPRGHATAIALLSSVLPTPRVVFTAGSNSSSSSKAEALGRCADPPGREGESVHAGQPMHERAQQRPRM